MRTRFCAAGARLLVIATAALAFAVQAHAASSGCDAINAGAWNGWPGTVGSQTTTEAFEAGEVIHLTGTATANAFTYLHTQAGSSSSSGLWLLDTTVKTFTWTVYQDQDRWIDNTNGGTATITATCTVPGPGPGPTPSNKDASQSVAKGFLAARINGILLNDPGATSLMSRTNSTVPGNIASAAGANTNVASNATAFGKAMGLGSGLGNAMALGASALGDDGAADTSGGKTIQFSQSLSQLRRQAAQAQASKDRMALGAGDGSALPLAYEGASPWDFWVEGRYSAFDDDGGNLDRSGHVGVLYAGVDYRFGNNVLAGLLVQFDWSKDDTGVLSSKVEGNGWMMGPYVSARLHENIFVDVRAAWGGSNNDLTLGDTKGTFDTTRWLVKGTLAGNWTQDAWRFTPSAELAYVEENQNVFTNSAGVLVPSQTVSLGRLEFGPEIGYRFAHTATTFVEPFAAIKGVWDFDNPNVAIIDGFTVGPGDFWGRLQGGLNVVTTSGLYVRGLASWDGLGADDYNGYTLQGTINVPLN